MTQEQQPEASGESYVDAEGLRHIPAMEDGSNTVNVTPAPVPPGAYLTGFEIGEHWRGGKLYEGRLPEEWIARAATEKAVEYIRETEVKPYRADTEAGLEVAGSLTIALEAAQVEAEHWESNCAKAVSEIEAVQAASTRLAEVMKEIAEGKGPYSRHPLTHAENVIESMKELANDALATKKA